MSTGNHHHSHDHEHHGHHDHEQTAEREMNEITAELSYMLSHNVHHLEEFEGFVVELRHVGQEAPASLVEEAVSLLRTSCEKLQGALDELKEES